MPNYWLLKTEPGSYSFADLERDGATVWDGVRNNVALKHMRSMQAGDLALIYHTGTERQAVGIAELTSAPYPDPQADLTDNRTGAVLVVVDVRLVRRLAHPVSLATIKAEAFFADFALVRQSRLSVVPVNAAQWAQLLQLAGEG